MALTGNAFLCLWNDIEDSVSQEYERWHTSEHVPERVAAPGFLSGRRYSAFERDEGRYLTIYDLATLAALDTPEYVDLQQNPTPWSARMRPHFRNVLRIPFETVASSGDGCAAHVAVYAFETDSRGDGTASRVADLLSRRCEGGATAAYHVGRALDVPAYGVFELPADVGNGRQKIIAIQELTNAALATEALHWMQARVPAELPVARVLRAETSALLFSVSHDEVAVKWRRPHHAAAPGLRSET